MSVTLEDIQNLSTEVRDLVKAGLPLETHLATAGRGHGKRLEQLTEEINRSLSAGHSLDDTIRQNQFGAPRILAAAVAAGVRTGRLGESIEMLGDMAGDLVSLRQRILQSISYPLTIVAMGLLLFCIFIRNFFWRMKAIVDDPHVDAAPMLKYLLELDRTYWWWPYVFPVLGAIGLVMWFVSGRAASMTFRGPERLLLVLPGVRGLIRDLRFYSLSRMLAMLVERQVPLSESLLLAGACTGDDSLDDACRRTAAEIEQGAVSSLGMSSSWQPGALPPLLAACLMRFSAHEDQLRERLKGLSAYYQRRLQLSVLLLRNVVPVAMFVIIGGGTVVLYAMTVFWPVTEIYRILSPA